MKIHPDCIPCLKKQMESAARACGAGEETLRLVDTAIATELDRLYDETSSPPAVSAPLYALTGRMCGVDDPYLAMKVRYTREALKLLPEARARVDGATDPFHAAVRTAIAGNVIDFGTGIHGEGFDLVHTLDAFLEKPLFIDHVEALREKAHGAGTILYIGDNAGETVFDRPLLDQFDSTRVVYAAKDGAVINDATVKDAVLAGVHLHARVVSTGSRAPGTILEDCSAPFRELFESADLVIAKGQGNYETITELPPTGRIFMLFLVKCPVAARHLGASLGDMVVMKW